LQEKHRALFRGDGSRQKTPVLLGSGETTNELVSQKVAMHRDPSGGQASRVWVKSGQLSARALVPATSPLIAAVMPMALPATLGNIFTLFCFDGCLITAKAGLCQFILSFVDLSRLLTTEKQNTPA
jgi:hypothetical protein